MPVNVIPFFSPIADSRVVDGLTRKLEDTGAKVLQPDEFLKNCRGNPSLLAQRNFLYIGTGGTENLVTDFLREAGIHPPIMLLSYEERNSLPAAMELRAYVSRQNLSAKIIHAPLEELLSKVASWVRFSSILEKLHSARIALLGKPSSWLVASNFDRSAINAKWGVKIQDLSMDEFVESLGATQERVEGAAVGEFIKGSECLHVPEDEVLRAMAVAQKMSDLVDSANLDGLSVECFTLFEKTGITGCHALSLLNNLENVVAGCEGDIPATFTLLIAKLMTGKPSFMANVTHVDPTGNTVTFAHCTVPTGITESYEIMTHFETGQSVGIRGRLKTDRITVLKVFGDDLSEYWVSGGTILENQENENICRTQVLVELDEPVSYFLEASLANHHIICLGDYANEFQDFFSFSMWHL